MWAAGWPFRHLLLASWAVVGGADPVPTGGWLYWCSCARVISSLISIGGAGLWFEETVKEEVIADEREQKRELMEQQCWDLT